MRVKEQRATTISKHEFIGIFPACATVGFPSQEQCVHLKKERNVWHCENKASTEQAKKGAYLIDYSAQVEYSMLDEIKENHG